jgi:hypothetical protein
MSPEERVQFELRTAAKKSQHVRIPLTMSHLTLVQYKLRSGTESILCHLYVPYMYDNLLLINDRRSIPRKIILEQTISRVRKDSINGISVSPIRVNLLFNRNVVHRVVSYLDGTTYENSIISAYMFDGKTPVKLCECTIIHYLLARFGFVKTIKRFGYDENDISFVTHVSDDADRYEYFAAIAPEDDNSAPNLFLKVDRTALGSPVGNKLVVNLMYILKFFTAQTIDNVYVQEASFWMFALGVVLYSKPAPALAVSNAATHLKSVDHFFDPLTKERFAHFKLFFEDIYDLIEYIFINIDTLMLSTQSQDVYNGRIDVVWSILVETFARKMFNSMYRLSGRATVTHRDVAKATQFNASMFVRAVSGRKDDSESYIAPPDIVNDNYLFSGGLTQIRLGGGSSQRFHTSKPPTQSMCAFVGKTTGKAGHINPYIKTDSYGTILRPNYADDIDVLRKYLPK